MTLDSEILRSVLGSLTVRVWRLHLETPGVVATVPLLRGVWGAALRAVSENAYKSIFEGGAVRVPRYWLRPAPQEARPVPAVEWCLIGPGTAQCEPVAWEAWDRACRQGLGPERRAFVIKEAMPLAWDETALTSAQSQPGFALEGLPWPAGRVSKSCQLAFPAPLRLLRDHRLVQTPTPSDLTLAAIRRICSLCGVGPDANSRQGSSTQAEALWSERRTWLERSRELPFEPWQGQRLDLVRFSGSQHEEIEMHGVTGSLTLPEGPGPLAPLLAAARWLHLGKGTVMGMGQMEVIAIDSGRVPRSPARRSLPATGTRRPSWKPRPSD